MSLLFAIDFTECDALADLTSHFGLSEIGYNAATFPSDSPSASGGKCLSFTSAYSTKYLRFIFNPVQDGKTLYGVVWYKSTQAVGHDVLVLYNSALYVQVVLRVNWTGYLELRTNSNNGGSLLATGTNNINNGSWHCIEFSCLVANAGTFVAKVNGLTDINFSGDTQAQSTNSLGFLEFGSLQANTTDFKLIYPIIGNGDGSINNTYYGQAICETLAPTSDSAIQWTRSTGADSYALIDDAIGAPNDADYNSASVSGNRDEYGLANLATTPTTVYGLIVNTRVSKTDAGAMQVKYGVNSGGTRQSVTVTPGVGAANYQAVFETSDGAGTAWTGTTVNAALSLVEIV